MRPPSIPWSPCETSSHKSLHWSRMALGPALLLLFLLQTDHAAEGRKALEANNFALAAEQYQKAVDADPKDWASRFHLGLAFSFLNKDTEAIAAYRKVLEDQPGL